MGPRYSKPMSYFPSKPPMHFVYRAMAYCAHTCKLQGIDSSHDHTHMTRVARTAIRLNALCGRRVSYEEEVVMILAAFTHDLCDRKYTDVRSGLVSIRRWLRTLPITDDMLTAVITIISTMSYSKVTAYGYPTDLGKWELAYHHVRIADLIDAYDVRRCYNFQSHSHPDMSEADKWQAVVNLFESRVLTQLDLYITPVAPYAVSMARARHILAANEITYIKESLLA